MKMGFDWTGGCGQRSLFYCIAFSVELWVILIPITTTAETVNWLLDISENNTSHSLIKNSSSELVYVVDFCLFYSCDLEGWTARGLVLQPSNDCCHIRTIPIYDPKNIKSNHKEGVFSCFSVSLRIYIICTPHCQQKRGQKVELSVTFMCVCVTCTCVLSLENRKFNKFLLNLP